MLICEWFEITFEFFFFSEIMAGPMKKCFKLCCHFKAVASSKPWNSTHLREFIMRTPKSRFVESLESTQLKLIWSLWKLITQYSIYFYCLCIKVVKQMPTIASNRQPTIAIITAQYCEKLAVDAMLENKETFVRYTTVGELSDFSYSFLY